MQISRQNTMGTQSYYIVLVCLLLQLSSFALADKPKDLIKEQIEQAFQLWEDNELDRASRLLDDAEEALKHAPDSNLQAILQKVRCQVLFAQGEYAQAIESNQLIFQLPGIEQLPKAKANLMLCHAQALERRGDSSAAIALLEDIYQLTTQHNLKVEKGSSLYIKGQFLGDLGNTGEALIRLEEAHSIFRSLNDADNLSNVLSAMANIVYYEKNYAKAIEYYLELEALTADDPFQQSTILYNLGNTYLALDELIKAQSYFVKSGDISQQIDDVPGVAYAKFGLAKVAFSDKDHQDSLINLEQAQKIFNSLDMQNQVAQIKAYMAHNYVAQKQYHTAEKLYQAALKHYRSVNIKPGIQTMNRTLADVYAKQNKHQEAYEYLLAYIDLFTEQVNNNKEQALAKMQVLYDTEKKEFENKYLTRELRLQTNINEQVQQQNRLKSALLVSCLFAIILMGYLIRKHVRHKELYRRMSQTDELTQLNNRRQILSLAENCFELFKRHRTPATLLVFDIDHFKQFNDRYGHDVGDEVLKKVADTAQTALRRTDHIGRIGGEEFLVVLTNTHQAVAFDVAERLRAAIESIFNHDDKIKSVITISIGGVEMKHRFNTLNEVVKDADNALYSAKEAGRNCIKFL